MNNINISHSYSQISEKIANEYQDRHVPPSVMSYYFLSELISIGSVEKFIKIYGSQVIDLNIANQGKIDLSSKSLNEFEIAAIELLNNALPIR